MGDIDEAAKMIDQKIYEAAERARREDQMTEVVSKKSSAQYNINTMGPSPFITTGAIKGAVTGVTLGASVEVSREQWLEQTQHMRVVALNEACEIAKAHISCGESMAAKEITSMASLFANFLVHDKA